MSIVKVQEVTIVKRAYVKGGSQIEWEVSLNNRPFGMISTFKRQAGYRFKFLAKALNGRWGNFDTFAQAETFMRGLM